MNPTIVATIHYDLGPARRLAERLAAVRFVPTAVLYPVAYVAGMYLALRTVRLGDRELFSRASALRLALEGL